MMNQDWIFYICCVAWILFACLPMKLTAAASWIDQRKSIELEGAVELVANYSTPSLELTATTVRIGLPVFMRWAYVPPSEFLPIWVPLFEFAGKLITGNCTGVGWADLYYPLDLFDGHAPSLYLF
jgi:hypothetical protein